MGQAEQFVQPASVKHAILTIEGKGRRGISPPQRNP
jgi:hypothetical protein